MRIVNLAHGSLYLLGAYLGWTIANATGSWYLALIISPLIIAGVGVLLQQGLLRRIQGQDLREALVTIGVSIIVGDLLIAYYGGPMSKILFSRLLSAGSILVLGRFTFPRSRRLSPWLD